MQPGYGWFREGNSSAVRSQSLSQLWEKRCVERCPDEKALPALGSIVSMPRTLAMAAVVIMVVLAGCSGIFSGGDSTSNGTATPTVVPSDEPTATQASQLAPGLTNAGIVNPQALLTAHTTVLRNASFTSTSNSTVTATNGSVLAQSSGRLRAGPVGTGVYSITTQNSNVGTVNGSERSVRSEGWLFGDRFLTRQTYANGTTAYGRQAITGQRVRAGIASGSLTSLLASTDTNNTTVNRIERNGSTLYRVEASFETRQGTTNVRLLVNPSGVVRSYRTVTQYSPQSGISRSVTTMALSDINATAPPERPSWVRTALNRTTPRSTQTAD